MVENVHKNRTWVNLKMLTSRTRVLEIFLHFPKRTPTQSVIFHEDLLFMYVCLCPQAVQQVRPLVCPRPHLSSCSKSHFWEACAPAAKREIPLKFQNTMDGWTHVARSSTGGRRGDYGGLRPSLILHFSSLQHLLPFPELSKQEKFSSWNLNVKSGFLNVCFTMFLLWQGMLLPVTVTKHLIEDL